MGNCCRSISADPAMEMERSRPGDSDSGPAAPDAEKRQRRSLSTPLTDHDESRLSLSAYYYEWTSSQAYGCASFDVTSKATTLEWKGYGLKIQILDDSIPHYITTARLDVSVHCINRPKSYLPVFSRDDHDHRPISALYSIKIGSGRLCKPVTIEIQHCLSLVADELTLLRTCNEGQYFGPVADTVFNQTNNCGRVTVPKLNFIEDQEYDDFSWFIIAIRRCLFRNTIHYKAQVYISKTTMMMHFIITMALDPCSTVSCMLTAIILILAIAKLREPCMRQNFNTGKHIMSLLPYNYIGPLP